MSIRVDSLSTEVIADAVAPGGTEDATQGTMWQEQEKLSSLRMRMMRDELRTASAGYDD
jgi:hypothetical protein